MVIAAGVYGQELIGSAGGNAEIHLTALELGVYPLLHKGGVGGLKGVLYALVVGGPPGIIIEGLFGLLIVYLIERPYLPLPVDAVKGYLPGAALGGLEVGQGVGVQRFLALAVGALGLAQVYLLNVVELMEHGLAHAGIMGGYHQILPYAVGVRSGYVMVHIYCARGALLTVGVLGGIAQLAGGVVHYGVVDISALYLYPAHGLVVLGLLCRDLLGVWGGICRRGGLLGLLGGGDRRYYRLRRARNYYIYYLIIFLFGAAYGQKAEGDHHKGNEFFHYAFILL